MMMIVDLTSAKNEFVETVDRISQLGEEIGVDIRFQHQDIFDNMHRI